MLTRLLDDSRDVVVSANLLVDPEPTVAYGRLNWSL
jgi:hypothetical protein